jgi:alpha-beta hydrolase superfamily lysophospholipase
MGGGIALRYAEKAGLPPVDGYLLFAPNLGWTAPTARNESTSESAKAIQVHIPRILGLALMNAVGVRAFNGLQTLFFNLPAELPLRAYTYRASESMSPKDYRTALAAVRAPLLVLVGSRDEAFKAEEYEAVIRANSNGTVTLVPEATHNGVLHDPRTLAKVSAWASAL